MFCLLGEKKKKQTEKKKSSNVSYPFSDFQSSVWEVHVYHVGTLEIIYIILPG